MRALNRLFHYLGYSVFQLIWINRIWFFYFSFAWKNTKSKYYSYYKMLFVTSRQKWDVISCICILCFKTFLMRTWRNWHAPDCALWAHAGKALASLEGRPGQSTDGRIIAENENQEVMTLGPTFPLKKGSLKLTSYASQTPSGHNVLLPVFFYSFNILMTSSLLSNASFGGKHPAADCFIYYQWIYLFSQSLQSFISKEHI